MMRRFLTLASVTAVTLCEYDPQLHGKDISALIDSIRHSERPIAIWGCGAYLRYLWEESHISQCNIQKIVGGSTRKQGKAFLSHIIQAPEELIGFEGTVLVTAMRSSGQIQQKFNKLEITDFILL